MTAANEPQATASAGGLGSKIPRERIDHAITLWTTGRSSTWCQQQLCERWGVTARAARRYLQIARERLRTAIAATAEDARERAERQLQAAFDCAAEKSDAKAMVLAASRLGELAGVLGTQRIEVSGKNGGPIRTEQTAAIVLLPPLDEPEPTHPVATEPGTTDKVPGIDGR